MIADRIDNRDWNSIAAQLAIAALCCLLAYSLYPADLSAQGDTPANADEEIVYIDSTGVIRVIDFRVPTGGTEVQWFSPSGGWLYIAAGDFNADGDIEILAGGIDGAVGKVAIFDPVAIQGSSNSSRVINGIPWDILYETTLPSVPELVAAGNFDVTRPGDEAMFLYRLPPGALRHPDDPFRFIVFNLTQVADGAPLPLDNSWDTGNPWTNIAVGNVDGNAGDEVALIQRHQGNLSVYRVQSAWDRIYRRVDVDMEWRDVAIGQFTTGGAMEVAAVRSTRYPLHSLFVLRYNGNTLVDESSALYIPEPDTVFMADISGNGDDEIIMLRKVDQFAGPRPRMFVHNNAPDQIPIQDQTLDADNGYRKGAGGDLDGNGTDEVIIMRNNRIRVYTSPAGSNAFTEFNVATNDNSILTANLDAEGIDTSARLLAVPNEIVTELVPGTTSDPFAVRVSRPGGESASYTAQLREGSEWATVRVNSARGGEVVEVVLSAEALGAGTYQDTVLLMPENETGQGALVEVDVVLTVRSGVAVNPAGIAVTLFPCDENLSDEVIIPLEIGGTAGMSYTLTLDAPVPWLEIESGIGAIPDVAEVRVLPELLTGSALRSGVAVDAHAPDVQGHREYVPISVMCAQEQLYVPVAAR